MGKKERSELIDNMTVCRLMTVALLLGSTWCELPWWWWVWRVWRDSWSEHDANASNDANASASTPDEHDADARGPRNASDDAPQHADARHAFQPQPAHAAQRGQLIWCGKSNWSPD